MLLRKIEKSDYDLILHLDSKVYPVSPENKINSLIIDNWYNKYPEYGMIYIDKKNESNIVAMCIIIPMEYETWEKLIKGECFENNINIKWDTNNNKIESVKEKKIDLEEIIKLYNRSYDDSIDYGKILENIKEKKCILCPFKNTIPLPCSCDNCKYCVHLPTYFNNTELKTGFYCPNRVRYDREKMFKLGKLLLEFNIDSSSVIKYFIIRLLNDCCLCGINFVDNKFEKKLYDANKDEYANKFLYVSTIFLYLFLSVLFKLYCTFIKLYLLFPLPFLFWFDRLIKL